MCVEAKERLNMYAFSAIPQTKLLGNGKTNKLYPNTSCHFYFRYAADSDEFSVNSEDVEHNGTDVILAKISAKARPGYIRLIASLPDFYQRMIAIEGNPIELELSFLALSDQDEAVSFDFISILQSPSDKKEFRHFARFAESHVIGRGRLEVTRLRAKFDKKTLGPDIDYQLAFQFPMDAVSVMIGAIILDQKREGFVISRPPEAAKKLPLSADMPYLLLSGPADDVRVAELSANSDSENRTLTAHFNVQFPRSGLYTLELLVDSSPVIGCLPSLDMQLEVRPKTHNFGFVVEAAAAYLLDQPIAFLTHRTQIVSNSTIPRLYHTTLPQITGLSGRKVILYISSENDPAESEFRLMLRASNSASFALTSSLLLPEAEKISLGAASNEVPDAFDDGFFLRQVATIAGESTGTDLTRYHGIAAWRLFNELQIAEVDPNPFFSILWYRRQRSGTDAAEPLSPAEAFRTYLSNDGGAFDPHPMIDERYVRAQYETLYDTPAPLALTIVLTSTDFRINPNRLFDTAEVAKAMRVAEGSMSLAELIQKYTSEPDFWAIATSPLFSPSAIAPTGTAPLLEYLSNPACWSVSPTPLFDPAHFYKQPGVPRTLPVSPLTYYLAAENEWRWSPGSYFDPAYYATQDVAVWSGKASALKTFTATLVGEPHRKFVKRYYLSAASPERTFKFDVHDIVEAKNTFSVPQNVLTKSTGGVIVQMTPENPRNPYYIQFPSAFRAAGFDFRFSTDQAAMADYAMKRKDLTFWYHQLEPMYHDPHGAKATRSKATTLISTLRKMKDAGATLVHTWHNALPYNPRYHDIDYEVMFSVAELFDLIIVHAKCGVPWIRKFTTKTPVAVVPFPTVINQYNTVMKKEVARAILGLDQEIFLVHHFGEMRPYKNLDLLIKAWERINRDQRGNNMVLALTGKWSKRDETFLTANRLKNTIVVDRMLSDRDLATWVSAADVCVFTHLNVWASSTIMQAISSGKMTIVPDNTGMVDLIDDDENGFIFRNHDIDHLVNTIFRANDFRFRCHAEFLNRSLTEELHPYRLQPEMAALFENAKKTKG